MYASFTGRNEDANHKAADVEQQAPKPFTFGTSQHAPAGVGGPSLFPEHLPPRTQPAPSTVAWNAYWRNLWAFNVTSIDPFRASDAKSRLRRIAILLVLVLRTVQSLYSMGRAIAAKRIVDAIVFAVLWAVFLYFTATCLAIISNARGVREVFGRIVRRIHLDYFLLACVIVHLVLLAIDFIPHVNSQIPNFLSVGIWLLIFAFAVIANRPPLENDQPPAY